MVKANRNLTHRSSGRPKGRRLAQTLGCSKCIARPELQWQVHAEAAVPHFRAPSFVTCSHISGNASNRSPELGRVYQRKVRVPVSGSRSARQCCAWQTVRGCCRQGVNRLRSKAVPGSIQREASALRLVACFGASARGRSSGEAQAVGHWAWYSCCHRLLFH